MSDRPEITQEKALDVQRRAREITRAWNAVLKAKPGEVVAKVTALREATDRLDEDLEEIAP